MSPIIRHYAKLISLSLRFSNFVLHLRSGRSRPCKKKTTHSFFILKKVLLLKYATKR